MTYYVPGTEETDLKKVIMSLQQVHEKTAANTTAISGIVTGGRETLTVARTYYVRTDGSDSNTGLVDSAGGAFLTVQKAIDTVAALDLSIYSATISVGAGTFTTAIVLKSYLGTGPVAITGAGATTIFSVTSDNAVFGSGAGIWTLNSVKIVTTTGGSGIFTSGNTTLSTTGIEFGACATAHIRCSNQSPIRMGAYTISGSSPIHYLVESGGRPTCVSVTVTLTGTPAFSNVFASVSGISYLWLEGVTWSGAATGARYTVKENSVLNTATGSITTLPGNAAHGTPTASGGQYL